MPAERGPDAVDLPREPHRRARLMGIHDENPIGSIDTEDPAVIAMRQIMAMTGIPDWAIASPVYKDGYRDSLDAIDENGCIEVPQGPGLGVEYDWDYITEHSTGVTVYE